MSEHAHSKVELKISCEDLPYSSTQVVLLTRDSQSPNWEATSYETEVITNSSNPEFVTGIVVDYVFEILQQFRFLCINVNRPNDPDCKAQRVIGYYEYDLGSIVRDGKVRNKLYLENRSHGFINISAEEVKESRRNVKLQIRAHNIPKTGLIVKQTPRAFVVLSRVNEDGTFSPIYETQTASSVNPSWPEFDIKESTLCNCDYDRALQLQVKHDKNGEHVLLGECTVTLRELLESETCFRLTLPRGSRGNIPRNSTLTIRVTLKETPTFLDYIASGAQMNLIVAIDFTKSNGDPRMPDSLHYMGNRDNDYQQAIRSVGTILEQYDSDKKIPVYGFGGKFNGNLSHCHPLNNNSDDPEVDGIDGVMEVYRQTIRNVELCGPTNFSPIINNATATIREDMEAGKEGYYILLIITDGVITDMGTTIRAIVKARDLPFSIVIVGVGNDDFKNMKILDGDDERLTIQDSSADAPVIEGKDIVQFVAMREFKTETARNYFLPKAIMEEIPDQFMSYMLENKIRPRANPGALRRGQ